MCKGLDKSDFFPCSTRSTLAIFQRSAKLHRCMLAEHQPSGRRTYLSQRARTSSPESPKRPPNCPQTLWAGGKASASVSTCQGTVWPSISAMAAGISFKLILHRLLGLCLLLEKLLPQSEIADCDDCTQLPAAMSLPLVLSQVQQRLNPQGLTFKQSSHHPRHDSQCKASWTSMLPCIEN